METKRIATAVLNILKGANMVVHSIFRAAAAGTENSN
jgi:hypothetical protein